MSDLDLGALERLEVESRSAMILPWNVGDDELSMMILNAYGDPVADFNCSLYNSGEQDEANAELAAAAVNALPGLLARARKYEALHAAARAVVDDSVVKTFLNPGVWTCASCGIDYPRDAIPQHAPACTIGALAALLPEPPGEA